MERLVDNGINKNMTHCFIDGLPVVPPTDIALTEQYIIDRLHEESVDLPHAPTVRTLAWEEGYEQGWDEGHVQGYDEGCEDGWNSGYDEARSEFGGR